MSKSTFVNFNIGNACNLRCKFCYNDKERDDVQFFMKKEEVFESLKNLKSDTDGINIIGGEPFMHPDIMEILDYIQEIGFTKIKIVTNGIRLGDENFTRQLLTNYKIHSIAVSVHSHSNELEDNITQRKNIFEKKLQGIDNLFKIKNELNLNIFVGINITLNNININHLYDIVKFYYERFNNNSLYIGMSGMILTNTVSDNNILNIARYKDVIENLNKLKVFYRADFLINWIPLCVHNQVNRVFYKIRELTPEFVKSLKDNGDNLINSHKRYKSLTSQKCLNCYAYNRYCDGIYYNYLKKFGDDEFKTLTKSEVEEMYENNIIKI